MERYIPQPLVDKVHLSTVSKHKHDHTSQGAVPFTSTSRPPRYTLLCLLPLSWHTPSTRRMAGTAVARRASPGRATPLPSESLRDALDTMELLGLGIEPETSGHSETGGLAAAVAGGPEGGERSGDRSKEGLLKGMEALLERGTGPDSTWRCGEPKDGDSSAGGVVGGDGVDDGDHGWRCFAGRMGREEAEALLRYVCCTCSWLCWGDFSVELSFVGVLRMYVLRKDVHPVSACLVNNLRVVLLRLPTGLSEASCALRERSLRLRWSALW